MNSKKVFSISFADNGVKLLRALRTLVLTTRVENEHNQPRNCYSGKTVQIRSNLVVYDLCKVRSFMIIRINAAYPRRRSQSPRGPAIQSPLETSILEANLATNTELKRSHHIIAASFCDNRRVDKRLSEIATRIYLPVYTI